MPHCVLSEEEVRANLQSWKHVRNFIQACLQTISCKPNDIEMLEHLNLRRWLVGSEYDWINARVVNTYLVLIIEVTLHDVDIMVGDPSEWLVLLEL